MAKHTSGRKKFVPHGERSVRNATVSIILLPSAHTVVREWESDADVMTSDEDYLLTLEEKEPVSVVSTDQAVSF